MQKDSVIYRTYWLASSIRECDDGAGKLFQLVIKILVSDNCHAPHCR